MMHHPSGAARGQASDIQNEARELMRVRDYTNSILAQATGKPADRVRRPLPPLRPHSRGITAWMLALPYSEIECEMELVKRPFFVKLAWHFCCYLAAFSHVQKKHLIGT